MKGLYNGIISKSAPNSLTQTKVSGVVINCSHMCVCVYLCVLVGSLMLGRRCGVCVFVSPLAGLTLGRRCGVCVCLCPNWLASRWAVGVECVCVCVLTGWPHIGP